MLTNTKPDPKNNFIDRDSNYLTNGSDVRSVSEYPLQILSTSNNMFPSVKIIVSIHPKSRCKTTGEKIDLEQSIKPSRISPTLRLIGKVRDLRTYEDDWNGQGSKAPSVEALDQAEFFVRSLKDHWEDTLLPHISVASDGEVCFWWKRPNGVIDLGFDLCGFVSYYASVDGNEWVEDEISVENLLKEDTFLDILKDHEHIRSSR